MWDKKYRQELIQRRQKAEHAGGEARIDRQHNAGKMTARERIKAFFDPGSFVEIDSLVESRGDDYGMQEQCIPGDGVIVGYGLVNGRTIYVSVQDFTVMGGTLGEYHSRKICQIMDMALRMRAPYVSINDSGGARIEEGITSLDGYSGIFYRNTKASGVIPQISVILGPCAGGACYSPAISDFIFMSSSTGHMFITGPKVVQAVTSEEISADALGGAAVHMSQSGVAHFVYDDDTACLEGVRTLLSYLPQSMEGTVPWVQGRVPDRGQDEFERLVPDNQRQVYDVKRVIEAIVDAGAFLEIQEGYARNIVIGLSRIDGRSVGIVANQPRHLGGVLDIKAAEKAARFIRFCDCFNIPLLTLVDVPGFLPGSGQEHDGIIRRGAKLLYAYAEATVPKITLILRKAFGGAYIAMNSKSMGADVVFAWPIAQTAVMGAEGAVDILYGRELRNTPNAADRREELIQDYEARYMTPYIAAKRGYIDEIILPEETRDRIVESLTALQDKERETPSKRHGNIPL